MRRFYLNRRYFMKILYVKILLSLFLGAIVTVSLSGCTTATYDPKNPFTGSYKNEVYRYYKETPELKACADREDDPIAISCSYYLAKRYSKYKKYEEAISYYKRAIDLYKRQKFYDPYELGVVYAGLGIIYLETGRYEEAILNYKNDLAVLKHDEDNGFSRSLILNLLGRAYYGNKQYEEAEVTFKKSIEAYPKNPSPYVDLSDVYIELKRYDAAIAALKRGIELSSNSIFDKRDECYSRLGKIYAIQEKYDDAVAAYQMAIELNPKGIGYYFSLADIFAGKEDYSSAIDILKKAQGQAPDRTDILTYIGYYSLAVGRFDEAVNSLSTAISLSTFTGIGMQLAIEDNFPVVKGLREGPAKRAGIEIGDKIIKIDGQSTKGWDDKEVSQAMKGAEGTQVVLTIERKNLDKPVEKTVIREKIIKKTSASMFGKRSFVYRLKGDTENSEKDAKQAYSLDPNDNWAKTAMSIVYIDKGKYDDAIKKYKEAIKIAPYFPLLYKAIALNYAELQQYQKAINNLKIYLELYPDAPDVREAKDEIYKWELMMEKAGK